MRKRYWFDKPSEDFSGVNGALPLGNGYMGMQIEDNIVFDKLSLNESTLWTGSPYENHLKVTKEKLEELQKKTLSDIECDFDWESNFVGMWGGQIFAPAGDLMIYMDTLRNVENYSKEIDLASGVLTTKFNRQKDRVTKEYFANYPNNVIIIKYSSDVSTLNLTTEIVSKMTGELDLNKDSMILKGRAHGAKGVNGAISYVVNCKIQTDGKMEKNNKRMIIRDAKECIFYLNISTNFISTNNLTQNPELKSQEIIDKAIEKGYELLKKEHIEDFSALFNKTKFELESDIPEICVTELSKRFSNEFNSAYVELMFNFNKYLIISSTRENCQPPTLQGKWNEKLSPSWDSKYTININLEMNYWSLNLLNLCESSNSLLNKMLAVMEEGKKVAKETYHISRGNSWVMHHNTDLWNECGAIDGCWGLTVVCGAWLINELFFRYEFTYDREYLKKLYPLFIGAVEFFSDFLTPIERNGKKYLVTCPSTSPERTNGKLGFVTYGSAFDNQILREMFENYLVIEEIFNENSELKQEAKNVLNLLPPPADKTKDGLLKEFYFHEYDFENDSHRHLAHMYGMYPGNSVYRERDEEIFKALEKSLDGRSKEGDWTGWGITWRIALYARLKNAQKSLKMLEIFLNCKNKLLLSNGFGACYYENGSIFQYDCNGAFPAVLLECFISSEMGEITLLSAVDERMNNGNIEGIRIRGAFIINKFQFRQGKTINLEIFSERGGDLKINVNGESIIIKTEPKKLYKII